MMAKTKINHPYLILLSLFVLFLSGCVYITHFDEVMFLKGLADNQKQMQAQLKREGRLYNMLKSDIDNGRLEKLTQKGRIFRLYGEPTLCKPAEEEGNIKEICIYRNPSGGLLAEIILLKLDAQDRLYSWEIQN